MILENLRCTIPGVCLTSRRHSCARLLSRHMLSSPPAREGNKENVKISAQCQNPRNEFPGSPDNAAIFSRDSDTRGILPQPAFSLLIVAQHHYSGLVIVLVICHLIIIIPPQKHSSLDHYSLLLLILLPNKGLRMRNC